MEAPLEAHVICGNDDCPIQPYFPEETPDTTEADKQPCPFCGSRARTVLLGLADGVTIADGVVTVTRGAFSGALSNVLDTTRINSGTATIQGSGAVVAHGEAHAEVAEATIEAFDATVEIEESTKEFRRFLIRSCAEAGFDAEDRWETRIFRLSDYLYRAEAVRLADGMLMRSAEDPNPDVALRKTSPFEWSNDSDMGPDT